MIARILSILIFVMFMVKSLHSHKSQPKKLLIISMDGFRWDYINKIPGKTPNFDRFKTEGGYAQNGMKNIFVSSTAPNHYALVTGLYSESHGIIGNTIYDPRFNETFSLFNSTQQYDSKWFDNGGEPIWVTNQIQSSEHRSGSIAWPGSYAAVNGIVPTRFILTQRLYYHNPAPYSFKSRIDTIIKWFREKYPINLGLLYFGEPDEQGHEHGPESQEVKDMIQLLDGTLGYLLEQLKKYGLEDEINIILTSDHGMTSAPLDKVVILDDYVDPTDYQVFGVNPVTNILPNEGEKETIYKKFKEASESTKAFDVYYKEDLPVEYHIKNNIRIQPIVLIAHIHYTLVYNISSDRNHSLGTHGYNNSLQDMHPFFMVKGPSFKAGATIETLNNVDIYSLMCHLLDLKPAPTNGSLDLVRDLLKEDDEHTVVTFATYIGILVFIALIAGVFTMAACRQHRNMKRKQRQMTLPGGVQFSTILQRESKLPLLSEESDDDSL
ncbi:hypothetical protein LOTGIDRAFT_153994 [Lottia gigantea]|uniref:AP3A hydrolase n=1 Tax=Lottia gigantea TaxID=225164 RepID=V3ZX38_LOTGI|nr:hypothetical protein LOTGIDRAFT_153994 [Lottia gigantea]ESO88927.1 hypothetical protein LOTGIDRAFT_153994 [Lottia gigantea]